MTDPSLDDTSARRVTRADLARAVQARLITPSQADALWAAWPRAPGAPAGPRFGFTNVLLYFGGLLAIGAMSLFMTLGWTALGPGGLLGIALAGIAGCLFAAERLEARALAVPAGILATLAIVMSPIAVWCVQHLLGLWPDGRDMAHFSDFHEFIDGRWLTLEIATLLAALAMLARHRHPFMLMPVAVVLWYASMDVADRIVTAAHGGPGALDGWALRREVSLAFGLVTVLVALWADVRLRLARSRRDFAFWLHVFGALMAWTSLTLHDGGGPLAKLAYGAANVALVLFGAAP
jgi:hypothetical protein